MANPRKFSEKIALHNQKQAEETAAFEKIMREVSDATNVKVRERRWPDVNKRRLSINIYYILFIPTSTHSPTIIGVPQYVLVICLCWVRCDYCLISSKQNVFLFWRSYLHTGQESITLSHLPRNTRTVYNSYLAVRLFRPSYKNNTLFTLLLFTFDLLIEELPDYCCY